MKNYCSSKRKSRDTVFLVEWMVGAMSICQCVSLTTIEDNLDIRSRRHVALWHPTTHYGELIWIRIKTATR